MPRLIGPLVGLFLCVASAPALAYAPAQVHALVTQAAHRHGVSPALAHAIVRGESGYRCHAKNPRSTAYGVFQIIRATGRGLRIDRTNCRQNIEGGMRLLRTVQHSRSRLCATYEAACKRSFRVARR
jgi:soluble lytic murein transglycosylase-like protein